MLRRRCREAPFGRHRGARWLRHSSLRGATTLPASSFLASAHLAASDLRGLNQSILSPPCPGSRRASFLLRHVHVQRHHCRYRHGPGARRAGRRAHFRTRGGGHCGRLFRGREPSGSRLAYGARGVCDPLRRHAPRSGGGDGIPGAPFGDGRRCGGVLVPRGGFCDPAHSARIAGRGRAAGRSRRIHSAGVSEREDGPGAGRSRGRSDSCLVFSGASRVRVAPAGALFRSVGGNPGGPARTLCVPRTRTGLFGRGCGVRRPRTSWKSAGAERAPAGRFASVLAARAPRPRWGAGGDRRTAPMPENPPC